MKRIFKNWKTSLSGVMVVASVVAPVITAPDMLPAIGQLLNDPNKLALLSAAVGLIVARDSKAEMPMPSPQQPPLK